MLNRFISLAGLALALSLVVPAAQQARSDYSPAALSEPGSVEISAPAAQPAPVESNLAVLTNAPGHGSALAAAPQAEEMRLEIYLGRREVLVYQGDRAISRYPIGVGRAGWETPVGTFEVRQMRENPTWISPFNGQRIPGGDARNPLGTRWIGFWTDGNNWIGFHGTRNPNTVGRNSSHGCIHMHQADLENLYHQVKLGTLVTVRP